MVLYRRSRIANAPYFLTVTLRDRKSSALVEHVAALRSALKHTATQSPITADAIVVLPDHFHLICTLPQDDADYSKRIRLIKRQFTLSLVQAGVPLQKDGRGEYRL